MNTHDRGELYDLTAAEVAPQASQLPISLPKFMALAVLLTVFATVLGGFIWTASTVTERTIFNWMDGYGFTPVTHAQPIAPASFSPASVTFVTLPGEVAQR